MLYSLIIGLFCGQKFIQMVTEYSVDIAPCFSKLLDSPDLLLCVNCHKAAVLCFALKAKNMSKGTTCSSFSCTALHQTPPFLTGKELGVAVMALWKQNFSFSFYNIYVSFPLPEQLSNIHFLQLLFQEVTHLFVWKIAFTYICWFGRQLLHFVT